MTIINEPGLYSLVMTSRKPEAKDFKRWVTHEVLPQIRQTGLYSVKEPELIEDLIIMQAKSVKELKQRVNIQQQELEAAKHRIDNLDAVNINGDLRQRLNQMIRKYAFQSGAGFTKAWNDFKSAFNLAYRTNIELLKTNYMKETGREISTPGILERRGLLEDAVRIADKMLNRPA